MKSENTTGFHNLQVYLFFILGLILDKIDIF